MICFTPPVSNYAVTNSCGLVRYRNVAPEIVMDGHRYRDTVIATVIFLVPAPGTDACMALTACCRPGAFVEMHVRSLL